MRLSSSSSVAFKGTSRLFNAARIVSIRPSAAGEHTHMCYHHRAQELESKHATGQVVHPHYCLVIRYENPSCYLRLSQPPNQPHQLPDFAKRNTPAGLMSGARSALIPSGPIAI